MQVANGEAMHNIMKATQADAKQSRILAIQSQKLAEKMKEDSIAMKTVRMSPKPDMNFRKTNIGRSLCLPSFSFRAHLSRYGLHQINFKTRYLLTCFRPY
jgi:hypothetical protein